MKDKNKAILEYVIRWLDSNIDEDSTMSESIKEDNKGNQKFYEYTGDHSFISEGMENEYLNEIDKDER